MQNQAACRIDACSASWLACSAQPIGSTAAQQQASWLAAARRADLRDTVMWGRCGSGAATRLEEPSAGAPVAWWRFLAAAPAAAEVGLLVVPVAAAAAAASPPPAAGAAAARRLVPCLAAGLATAACCCACCCALVLEMEASARRHSAPLPAGGMSRGGWGVVVDWHTKNFAWGM